MKYAIIFYIIMSLIAFVLYASDKRKAKKKRWRTPEAVLLGVGFLGGTVGALLGMKICHHKTKHWYFWAVNLLALVLHVALFVYLFILK